MASNMVPLMDDDTLAFGEEDDVAAGKLKHPFVTGFHLLFRVLSLLVYLFCTWFSNSFIASFVTILLLLSMDFWTVKNITGRLMVGLRWWNYVDDDGVSHWVYESRKGTQQSRINAAESRIFWTALIVCPVLWGVLFLVALFGLKFKWLMVVTIALILNGANLHGYVKCRLGHGQKLTTTLSAAASNFFRQQVINNVISMATRQNQPARTPSSQPDII